MFSLFVKLKTNEQIGADDLSTIVKSANAISTSSNVAGARDDVIC